MRSSSSERTSELGRISTAAPLHVTLPTGPLLSFSLQLRSDLWARPHKFLCNSFRMSPELEWYLRFGKVLAAQNTLWCHCLQLTRCRACFFFSFFFPLCLLNEGFVKKKKNGLFSCSVSRWFYRPMCYEDFQQVSVKQTWRGPDSQEWYCLGSNSGI